MPEFIITMLLGIVSIVLGTLNMKGNIYTALVSQKARRRRKQTSIWKTRWLGNDYHWSALIIFAVFALVATLTSNNLFYTIVGIELIVGVVIGIVIPFYAMFKYIKEYFRVRRMRYEKNKPVYVICQSGLRSYISCRILEGNGFTAYNFAGGFRFYQAVMNDRALVKRATLCGMDN